VRRAALLLGVASCGRLHFDPLASDATIDGDGRCAIDSPFGAPVLVAGLNTAGIDVTLRLQANELSGVFWTTMSGDADIYTAERPDLATPFSIAPLTVVNSVGGVDADPTVSADGSFLVFDSGRGDVGGFDLYESQRVNGSYQPPVLLAALSTVSGEGEANYSNAEGALYFESDRSGASHLYRAMRTGPATYDAPQLVTELSSTNEEFDPAPSADGLTMYFRSSRPGGPGGTDIFVATRASITDPWGNITLVPNVNDVTIDGPSFLSADQCRLYFTSDRTGNPKIYVASR